MTAKREEFVDRLSNSLSRQSTIEITARHRIAPYQQGELDCICGLYATINAVRLALANITPIDKTEAKRMLAAGAQWLSDRDGLHRALTWGMKLRRRHALGKHIAKVASGPELTVTIERPGFGADVSIDAVFEWIGESLAANEPVLLFLENLPDHYTVVAGITPSSLLLFDSIGMRLVRRTSCGVGCGTRLIAPSGLLRIAVEQRA